MKNRKKLSVEEFMCKYGWNTKTIHDGNVCEVFYNLLKEVNHVGAKTLLTEITALAMPVDRTVVYLLGSKEIIIPALTQVIQKAVQEVSNQPKNLSKLMNLIFRAVDLYAKAHVFDYDVKKCMDQM